MKSWIALILLFSLACSTNPKKVQYATTKPGIKRSDYEAKGKKYMMASQGEASTKAGAKMFELGGNAIDAAVAISFAISVERPQSTGIGGGGFMVIHFAKNNETIAVDFREKAPIKAHSKMYLDKSGEVVPKLSLLGPLSVGVPGLVAGLVEVHKRYGKLPLKTVMQPAIDLAENGFAIYPHLAFSINYMKDTLKEYPASAKIFLREDGTPKLEGDLLVQKDLAETLRRIASKGRDGFYRGPVANKIVATMKKHGGLISHRDLRKYNVKFRKPVWGTFKGLKVASMPPPSSGGSHVIQILNILEQEGLATNGPFSTNSVHLTASAMQRAFADRATYLGDADFVKVPFKGIIDKKYAEKLRESIEQKATPSKFVKAGNPWPFNNPYESDETTHFSVMDIEGNTVASTQTINYLLGSGVVAEGTGIVLNDEMDDFATKVGASNVFGAVGGKNNLIEPEKRPLSSMSPTILFKEGKPVMAVGTPSGTRIITCVTSTILNYVEYNMSLYDSVAALRYHHQWSPDEIRVDEPGFSSALTSELEDKGYKVSIKDLGCKVNAVVREGDQLIGVADPRGEGKSLGL